MTDYTGCDELRAWLVAQGFKIARNGLQSASNACDWYAYRRSAIPARECECNEGKPAQIVAYPSQYDLHGKTWTSVSVDITGEAGGIWYKLSAYSLSHVELMTRLPEIERNLVAAWNALKPNGGQDVE